VGERGLEGRKKGENKKVNREPKTKSKKAVFGRKDSIKGMVYIEEPSKGMRRSPSEKGKVGLEERGVAQKK